LRGTKQPRTQHCVRNNGIGIAKKTALVCCAIALLAQTATAQTYSFRNYGAERNIPNLFTYTLNQTGDGYLWIGTGSGIVRFDGFEFFTAVFPDSAAGRYPTASFRSSAGVLWYGCSDGTVFYVENRQLVQVEIPNTRSISTITESPGGDIFIIPQGRAIFSLGATGAGETEVTTHNHAISPVIFTGCFTPQGELLLGTQENIVIARPEADTLIIKGAVEGFNYAAVTSIVDVPGGYVAGADGGGVFLLTASGAGYALNPIKGIEGGEMLNVQSLLADSAGNIWVSTFGRGAIQFELSGDSAVNLSEYNTSTELGSNDVKSVFHDMEGNYWFASYGNGVSMLNAYAFTSFAPGATDSENNIIYVNEMHGRYILGTPSGFHLFNPSTGKSESFTGLLKHTGNTDITSYLKDSSGNVWFGTAGAGLYVIDAAGKVKPFYRSGDSGSDNIRDIKIDDRNLWLATVNGMLALDRRTGELYRRYDISNGLPHSSINTVFIDSQGRIIAGNNEGDMLFYIDRNYEVNAAEGTMHGGQVNRIQDVSQGSDGATWIATRGNGIFRFDGDTVAAVYGTAGLQSNYCYSILADRENHIWVGHETGFSKYNPATGTVRTYSLATEGASNRGALFETSNGNILIGTTGKLVIYNRRKDSSGYPPPQTNLNYITINDRRYDYRPVYTLPAGSYVIRLNFVGINFNAPDKVNYSVFVENFDGEWSRLSPDREMSYVLRDGRYRFNITSVNHEGASQSEPFSFVIVIKKPWWKTGWAIATWLMLLAATVALIVKIRERALKKTQEYLETELEARTSVIVRQKTEIEQQNIEITDSITYAKRIQEGMLPDHNKLREVFADAFVIYRPRDIVSGDYYWFEKTGKDTFMLVCADSTGHGVPGALMSMVGSTLLQDIVMRQHISTPSQILAMLDKQIFSTMNRNMERGISNDGMDMVVCEFNLAQRSVRFASAMRPVIMVMDGQSLYIRGNRASVGGESVSEKYFDDQEYYLNAGDSVYLFSDGLPDQFGGTQGKKMKVSKLRQLIEDISALPMTEQQEAINTFYDQWRGPYEQIDDILFMGVRM
jgi:ligand-binding sensor domain-containing protein/serine phosphatase RsbU (regulator of sigma subunit)